MKTFKHIIFLLLLVFTYISTYAQTEDLEMVKNEIATVAQKEQQAFKNGDCAQVLELMEPNITFLANGNSAPSIQMIEKFCNSLSRPFKEPLSDQLEIYPLTSTSGYTIRKLEFQTDAETKNQEFVTKIWRKTNGQWKISHLHSTVKKVPITN